MYLIKKLVLTFVLILNYKYSYSFDLYNEVEKKSFLHLGGISKHGSTGISFQDGASYNEIHPGIGYEENVTYKGNNKLGVNFRVSRSIDLMKESFNNPMLNIGIFGGIQKNIGIVDLDFGINTGMAYRSIKTIFVEEKIYSKDEKYYFVPQGGFKIGASINKFGINFLYMPKITTDGAISPSVAFFQLKYNIN